MGSWGGWSGHSSETGPLGTARRCLESSPGLVPAPSHPRMLHSHKILPKNGKPQQSFIFVPLLSPDSPKSSWQQPSPLGPCLGYSTVEVLKTFLSSCVISTQQMQWQQGRYNNKVAYLCQVRFHIPDLILFNDPRREVLLSSCPFSAEETE